MRAAILLFMFAFFCGGAVAQHVTASPNDQQYLLDVLAEATSDTGYINAETKQTFWLLAPERFGSALPNDPHERRNLVNKMWAFQGEWLASLRLTMERGVATLTPSFEASRLASNATILRVFSPITGELADGPFSRRAAEEMVRAVANGEPIDFFSQGRMVLTFEAIERAEEMHRATIDRTLYLFTP